MSRYLLLPFRGAPLMLVATFTLLLMIATRAGFLGMPLAAILSSWFFKYCFVLLDAVIAGEEEPPVLSAEMVNPLSEQRPLAQSVLIVLAVMAVGALGIYVGRSAAMVAGAAFLLALPASVGVLGYTGNPFRAAWPPSLATLIRGLGWSYVWITVAGFVLAGAVFGLAMASTPMWVLLAASMWALLMLFSLIGGAMHEQREELGIATLTRRERMAARDERDHIQERRRMLDEAYGQLRLRRSRDAWDQIDNWLAPYRGREAERAEYEAVLDAASQWDDPVIADRISCDYLTLLLGRRETGSALDLVEQRLAANPNFRLRDAAQLARLRELAALAGRRTLRRQLEAME